MTSVSCRGVFGQSQACCFPVFPGASQTLSKKANNSISQNVKLFKNSIKKKCKFGETTVTCDWRTIFLQHVFFPSIPDLVHRLAHKE